MSYCADRNEGKCVSAVKRGLIVQRLCHRFSASIQDFESIPEREVSHGIQAAHVLQLVFTFHQEIADLENTVDVSQLRHKKKNSQGTLKA